MTDESVFGAIAERLCRIRRPKSEDDESFPLDEDGFLNPVFVHSNGDSVANTAEYGSVVDPVNVATRGAFVLLGEPGVGKTTVFKQLSNGSATTVESSYTDRVWVNGADLSDSDFEELIGRHLKELPTNSSLDGTEPTDASVELTVIIDQFDECRMKRQLWRKMSTILKGRDVSGFRLLIGCRTADYPDDMTGEFQSVLGSCVLADLAPLTRSEAVKLATSAGLDGELLVQEAVRSNAGSLASVPLTLEFLVRAYRENGSLDGSPLQLFARGVLLMTESRGLDETNGSVASVDQKLAVAKRIAARLVLSGRRSIWQGSDLYADAYDLRSGSIAGGSERVSGGTFEVTNPIVMATFQTSLFTGNGEKRLAFRHSSIAAYLAACYLDELNIPAGQLSSLFLVPESGEAAHIPSSLRETAAWFVALNPLQTEWLAGADPSSLAAHSGLVDSPAMRSLIVQALLDRAGDIELSDERWYEGRWNLDHSGFVDQLLPVLSGMPSVEPDDWTAKAKIRLAVRLARSVPNNAFVEPLLLLAENNSWSAYIRQSAARAAYAANSAAAHSRLRSILGRYEDESYRRGFDEDDELLGTLLELLWVGEHLSISELLPFLKPRQNRNLSGTYSTFLSYLPNTTKDSDLPALVAWAAARVTAMSKNDAAGSDAENPSELQANEYISNIEPSDDDAADDHVDEHFIETLIDRVLASDQAEALIDEVSRLIVLRLRRHEDVPMPEALDVVDESGSEPMSCTELRRAVALSLARQSVADNAPNDSWLIVSGWSKRFRWPGHRVRKELAKKGLALADRARLLSCEDSIWAIDQAVACHDRGDALLGETMMNIAVQIFEPTNSETVDALIGRCANDIVMKHFASWIEPVPLDSEYATRQQRFAERRNTQNQWEDAEEFRQKVLRVFSEVVEGDHSSFWILAHLLQFDPSTGRGPSTPDDEIKSWPGFRILPENGWESFVDASVAYLAAENDRRDDWLGSSTYDRRGWAGYVALSALDAESRLAELPGGCWENWTGVIIWFDSVPVNAANQDRKKRLVSLAANNAPAAFAQSLEKYVIGELERGALALEVSNLEPTLPAAVVQKSVDLMSTIASDFLSDDELEFTPMTNGPELRGEGNHRANAIWVWDIFLRFLLASQDDRGDALALATVEAVKDGNGDTEVASVASHTLLLENALRYWPKIREAIGTSSDFGRDLARRCAYDRAENAVSGLDEAGLADVFRWLIGIYPPEDDIDISDVHWISRDESAQDWRNSVLRRLGNSGTSEAVAQLTNLKSEFPDRLDIASALIVARNEARLTNWEAPSPETLAALFSDLRRRIVRNAVDLLGVVIAALEEIAKDVPSHGQLLWDRVPKTLLKNSTTDEWRPKPEGALSSYLAHELKIRIGGRGAVVNREVLILPTNAYDAGERTDVHVQANLTQYDLGANASNAPPVVTVVIEVKGNWHDDVFGAQETQLAKDYLPKVDSDAGAFVVGWFDPELWGDFDARRRTDAGRDGRQRSELEASLREQASEIRKNLGVTTTPIVINIPRPSTQTRTA